MAAWFDCLIYDDANEKWFQFLKTVFIGCNLKGKKFGNAVLDNRIKPRDFKSYYFNTTMFYEHLLSSDSRSKVS